MEKADYIKIQDEAWKIIDNLPDNEEKYKSHVLEALKMFSTLDIFEGNGNFVFLYQHAKTLLGESLCLYLLSDTLDAIKVLDRLERLQPTFMTPCKDELKRIQTVGRDLRREILG